MLLILGQQRGSTRKRLRRALRSYDYQGRLHPREISAAAIPSGWTSLNETFNKQADLGEFFSKSTSTDDTVVGRTLLPLYKNLNNKQLKELIDKDGLVVPVEIANNRDELIKLHKEFTFTIQAGFDAVRMGMYSANPPTREGLASAWNAEVRLKQKSGRLGLRGKSDTEKRRELADKNQSVADMTIAANRHMMNQVQVALRQRQQYRQKLLSQEQDV